MNIELRFTRNSAADLDEISDFISRDNATAATAFIDELREVCKKLAFAPGMGRKRDELHAGLRSHPHGEYLIFYRVQREAVEILRVIHGARNIRPLFRR